MNAVKLIGVHMADQRKALSIINSPNFVSTGVGKNHGCGYWNQAYPHVNWWIWETAGGCVCIHADYNVSKS